MDKEKIKNVLECLLFVTNRPVGLAELSEVVGETQESVQGLLDEMKAELEDRKSALQIAYVGEGVQFASREGYSYWVKKLFRDQATFRLSQSALETLSIIAYKQPITRAEIEEIRGVEVIGVLETLIERKLVKVAGRKETVGRPLLYATTPEFLRHFNLWKISDLPSLEDLAREAERKKGEEPPGTAPTPAEPQESYTADPAVDGQPPAQGSSPDQTALDSGLESEAPVEGGNGNGASLQASEPSASDPDPKGD